MDKLLFTTEVVTPHTDAEKVKEVVDAVSHFVSEGGAVHGQLSDSLMPQEIRDLKEA